MSAVLTFVSHDVVHFRAYFTWVDVKCFVISPEASDAALLDALIRHPQYRDHYAGQEPTEQTHHSIHGPYRLAAISPEVFEPVTAPEARGEIASWVSGWIDSEESRDGVGARLAAEVLPRLDGDSILRLPDLRENAEHEWGWVVGQSGFHEFVVIDRGAPMLTLLVASDD